MEPSASSSFRNPDSCFVAACLGHPYPEWSNKSTRRPCRVQACISSRYPVGDEPLVFVQAGESSPQTDARGSPPSPFGPSRLGRWSRHRSRLFGDRQEGTGRRERARRTREPRSPRQHGELGILGREERDRSSRASRRRRRAGSVAATDLRARGVLGDVHAHVGTAPFVPVGSPLGTKTRGPTGRREGGGHASRRKRRPAPRASQSCPPCGPGGPLAVRNARLESFGGRRTPRVGDRG